MREVSQEYDCPQGMDFDLDGDSLVYKGQSFYCSGCGQDHIAGVDVQVSTMVEDGDERSWPDLPESADALRALVADQQSGDGSSQQGQPCSPMAAEQ